MCSSFLKQRVQVAITTILHDNVHRDFILKEMLAPHDPRMLQIGQKVDFPGHHMAVIFGGTRFATCSNELNVFDAIQTIRPFAQIHLANRYKIYIAYFEVRFCY